MTQSAIKSTRREGSQGRERGEQAEVKSQLNFHRGSHSLIPQKKLGVYIASESFPTRGKREEEFFITICILAIARKSILLLGVPQKVIKEIQRDWGKVSTLSVTWEINFRTFNPEPHFAYQDSIIQRGPSNDSQGYHTS